MSVLLFAYVCMLSAFETLSLLYNLVNKESESEFSVLSQETCDQNSPKYQSAPQSAAHGNKYIKTIMVNAFFQEKDV